MVLAGNVHVDWGARVAVGRRTPRELRSFSAPAGRAVIFFVDIKFRPIDFAKVNKMTIRSESTVGERLMRLGGTGLLVLDVGCCVNRSNSAGSVETSREVHAIGEDGGVVSPCGLGRVVTEVADKATADPALLGGVAVASVLAGEACTSATGRNGESMAAGM